MSFAFAILIGVAASDETQVDIVGDYLCTIAEKASVATTHLEDAGPPKAYLEEQLPTRFKMRVSETKDSGTQYSMVEIPYGGADYDQTSWHTLNSILHSAYVGDGYTFKGQESEAFVRFHRTIHSNDDGNFSFHHAGFEYPGGEDTQLSIRWGRCKRVK